ncbi:MAG: hypothetical protein E7379_03600 [Clostridiales bacterium]|nr:hypothetical protein [Clostridiales bacterium]
MYKKIYHYLSDKNVEKTIQTFLSAKKQYQDLKFIYMVNKEIFQNDLCFDIIKLVVKDLKSYGLQPHDVCISVSGGSQNYSIEEWVRVRDIDAYLSKKGVNFGFEDHRKTWTVEEVESANEQISIIANKVKKESLSPYEKLLRVYMGVASRKYRKEKIFQHPSESRSVYGVLNSNKCVCQGYSNLIKAIFEEIGEENITIYDNFVATSEDGEKARALHSTLVIHIKDEKYGLNGHYYFDATNETFLGKELTTLNFFMVPLSQIKHIKVPYILNDKTPLSENEKQVVSNIIQKSTDLTLNLHQDQALSFSRDSLVVSTKYIEDLMRFYQEFEDELKKAYLDSKYKEYETEYQTSEDKREEIISLIEKTENDLKDKKFTPQEILGNFKMYKNALNQLPNINPAPSLEQTMQALRIVVKNVRPNANDNEINEKVHKIIMATATNREIAFDNASQDEYVIYAKQVDIQNQKS